METPSPFAICIPIGAMSTTAVALFTRSERNMVVTSIMINESTLGKELPILSNVLAIR